MLQSQPSLETLMWLFNFSDFFPTLFNKVLEIFSLFTHSQECLVNEDS